MKVCLISNLYHPYSRGGAEQVVKNTIDGLKKRGVEVILITAQPYKGLSSLKPKPTEENGIKIYRFYPLNLFFYTDDYKHNALVRLLWHCFDVFNLHSYFVVKNILKREKPKIVHTHNLKGIGYLIPRAIRLLMLMHVHTLHDIQLHSPAGLMIKGEESSWQQKGILTKLYSKICKKLFNSPSVVISPSKWLMNYYYAEKNFFKKSKKIILRNPVDMKMQKCKNAKIRNNKFLFIGQIEKHKGVLFLIDVFNALYDLNIKLEIIGDGAALKKAKQIAQNNENITFRGKLSHEDTLNYLNSANFMVVPSLCYENSPNAVSEALSAGKPVIAANIGGAAELIIEGINGYKFEAGNEKDLINKIQLAIGNIDKFNANEIRSTAKEWGINNYIDRLIALY
jgi:glycosyltransferase involved in cell wall biosynthesis